MKFVLLLFSLLAPLYGLRSLEIEVNAESAILLNAETGKVLFSKNEKKTLYPASITKVATALYVLSKAHNLDEPVTADQESVVSIPEESKKRSNYSLPPYWLEPGSSHIGIKKGEILTVKDLLLGMMVASGNDASNVLAQHIGGTIQQFTADMNNYLAGLGCKDTFFINPHGLHHPKHVTTAYDMAIITKEALKNPTFCELVSTSKFVRPKTNKQEQAVLNQTNKLLRKGKFYYPLALGVKTGHTSKALNTFIAAARKDGRTLIAVLMKTPERDDLFKDAIAMFETAFNERPLQKTYFSQGEQSFTLDVEGAEKPIQTVLNQTVAFGFYPSEEPKIKCLLQWEPVQLPIRSGEKIGVLSFYDEEEQILKTADLLAKEDVNSTLLFKFEKLFSQTPAITILLALTIIFLLYLLLRKR